MESRVILDRLDARHVRYGYVDYWLSYKLTFSDEGAGHPCPSGRRDRYPRYAEIVRTRSNAPTIQRPPVGSDARIVRAGHHQRHLVRGTLTNRFWYNLGR